MRKLMIGWGITWRMIVHGVLLGLFTGAIYGPISIVIMYTAEIFNGRYDLSNFPYAGAVTYSLIAIIGGAMFGGAFGFFCGLVSGIILGLGLLLDAGHLLEPRVYRNVIVALGAMGASLIVLLTFSLAVLGDDWFFNGQGVVAPLIALAFVPAIVSAISTWWASMRVISWWQRAKEIARHGGRADLPAHRLG